MSLQNNELQFLWHLFQLYFFMGEAAGSLEWVASMYESCLNIPAKLESLLLEYWENGKESVLLDAALMSVRQNYFDAERQVILVAWLVEKGRLGIDEAASIIIFPGISPDAFSNAIRHAIDVAWLLNQDKKDGVMNPQQDSLLADALREVLNELYNGEFGGRSS